jgi:hypothetical protein
VHLEGVVKVPTGELKSIFTLPVGYRPAPGTLLIFQPMEKSTVAIGGSNTVLESRDLSGKVSGLAAGEVIFLDGITFRAAG